MFCTYWTIQASIERQIDYWLDDCQERNFYSRAQDCGRVLMYPLEWKLPDYASTSLLRGQFSESYINWWPPYGLVIFPKLSKCLTEFPRFLGFARELVRAGIWFKQNAWSESRSQDWNETSMGRSKLNMEVKVNAYRRRSRQIEDGNGEQEPNFVAWEKLPPAGSDNFATTKECIFARHTTVRHLGYAWNVQKADQISFHNSWYPILILSTLRRRLQLLA